MGTPDKPDVRPLLIRQLIARPIIWVSTRIRLTPIVLFGVMGLLVSIILLRLTLQGILIPKDLFLNIGTELVGVFFTVLVIDQIYRREADRAERTRLIRELGSPDNSIALKAARELEGRNWAGKYLARINISGANLDTIELSLLLFDGSNLSGVSMRNSRTLILDLRNACMFRANLSNTNVGLHSILEGAMLVETNMTGAVGIEEDDLRMANSLWGATMPDGSRYRGQYGLQGDLEVASRQGIDVQNQQALAQWYQRTPQRSQAWVLETALWAAEFDAKQAGWRHKLEKWMYGIRETR